MRADLPVATLMAIIQGVKEALVRAIFPEDRAATPEEIERLTAIQMDLVRRVCAPAIDAPGKPETRRPS